MANIVSPSSRYHGDSIVAGVNDHHFVLRITDGTSVSRLNHDGFTASHDDFEDPIPGRIWRSDHHYKHDNTEWLDEYDYEKIVKHVNGGWVGYRARSGGQSRWISTSASFEWTIWEIARRLEKLGRSKVYMTIITRWDRYSDRYRGLKDVQFPAASLLEDYLEDVYYGDVEAVEALRFARASSEMLYYGRIFAKNIVETTKWTADLIAYHAPPCDLPDYCYIPRKHWYHGQTWLDRLVWDPSVDTSRVAKHQMAARRDQLERSRR
ncbi:hypothetical protein IAR55_001864 [Kwoniella newhampshirensis]|uniref:Uncharacterized protein n=1 Tax=Kwoniella newhampshirensis TaxID=1651941 RepID=A0AAW0Z3M7_9TREE